MKIRGRVLCVCVSCTVSASLGASAPAAAQTTRAAALPLGSSVATPVPSTRIFAHLIQDSLGDFRRLPSSDTAIWLSVGAVAALIAHRADRPVSAQLSAPALHEPFEAGAAIGGAQMQLGGALATYTLGHLTGHSRMAGVGADLLRAQLVTKALTVALKVSAQRTRPDGTSWSFPSGHASASFASATVLQRHFGWKVGAPAFGIATYVAASRIQDNRHFLSDVAFGAAVGMLAGRTVTVGHGNGRFALAPIAAPGGAGVAVAWVGR